MTTIPRTILNGWVIALIEDEPDNAEVAGRLLQYYGGTVLTAVNGEEGLALIKIQRPTLVICDISMPVMDGWSFIKAMKADTSLADIPAIALTAHAMSGDREKAFAAGFHNYLTKPLTVGTFIHDLLSVVVDLPQFSSASDALK